MTSKGALKRRMKSRILGFHDAALLTIRKFQEALKNDARPRMWFKRQFLALKQRVNSRRI